MRRFDHVVKPGYGVVRTAAPNANCVVKQGYPFRVGQKGAGIVRVTRCLDEEALLPDLNAIRDVTRILHLCIKECEDITGLIQIYARRLLYDLCVQQWMAQECLLLIALRSIEEPILAQFGSSGGGAGEPGAPRIWGGNSLAGNQCQWWPELLNVFGRDAVQAEKRGESEEE